MQVQPHQGLKVMTSLPLCACQQQVYAGNLQFSKDSCIQVRNRRRVFTLAKDSYRREWFHFGCVPDSAESSADTAAEQAHLFQVCFGVNLGTRDFSKHSVFGKGGATHKVVDYSAVRQREPRCAVWHHTLALVRPDLWAHVGLG